MNVDSAKADGVVEATLASMLKSFVEEWFLRDNPDYAAYLKRVRYRWIPGLI